MQIIRISIHPAVSVVLERASCKMGMLAKEAFFFRFDSKWLLNS